MNGNGTARYGSLLDQNTDSDNVPPESPRAAHDDPIFRSAVCDMFEEPQSSKTDACAFFCCGLYLWQRNQDILMRERRKSSDFASDEASDTITSIIQTRPLETIFFLLIVVSVVLWSFDASNLSSIVLFGCILSLAAIAWNKFFGFQKARQKLREELAVAEYYRRTGLNQDDAQSDNDPGLAAFLEEHRHEIFGGGHNVLGCASSTVGNCFGRNMNIENEDSDANQDDENQGFCLASWRFLEKLCCGVLCGCSLQLFGMCAIAQESRHLGEAISRDTRPGLWQRDYITMQPWAEYYPSILRLRLSNQIHCLPHFKALSRLSRRILIASASVLLFVTVMFLLPIRFPKWQILIVSIKLQVIIDFLFRLDPTHTSDLPFAFTLQLYGTFLQPTVFLLFVHWLWNRLDLSVDAVVKYFACGFFICTSSAIVYEWLVSKLAEKFIMMLDRLGTAGFILFGDDNTQLSHGENWQSHANTMARPLWYHFTKALLTAFINAFFVAGLTEELCKYLCFWMVEHPDLEITNKVVLSAPSTASTNGKQSETSSREESETTGLLSQNPSPSSDLEQQPIFAPMASLVSLGEGITVAMVTLALGFACAENLLYIFVYTTPGFREEIGTLYVRCLFPIHPMTAALQSIGVCRRDLEKDSSVGIGKILLPAWLLHGLFDFSLMAYSTIREIMARHHFKTDYEPDPPKIEPGGGNPVTTADQGQPILMYVMFVPFVAMMYFLNESFYQRERLEKLDRQNRRRR